MKRDGLELVEYEIWRYRYLALFALSIIIAIFILSSSPVHLFIQQAGEWSYFGAFFVGLFYSYTLTSPLSAATFFVFNNGYNPFFIAIIGGFGAMIGDFFIFKFVKSGILPEAKLLAKDLKMPNLSSPKLIHMLHKFAPFIAGFIIGSPLPDEVGAAMFGAIRYDTKKFLIISFICHTLGILAIVLLGQLF